MKPAPLPNLQCPRCGKPNECAPAKCGTFDVDCWCRNVSIDPARLAEVDRSDACLCRECVQKPD
jgi:hypothetical protein